MTRIPATSTRAVLIEPAVSSTAAITTEATSTVS